MIRKYVAIFMMVCVLLSAAPLAVQIQTASAAQPLQMTVDGKKMAGVTPILKSGAVYVPYRKFFEAMGYKISTDPATKYISAEAYGTKISFKAGGDTLYSDTALSGTAYVLGDKIPVINGQVYLPLRIVGQLSGYSVVYDKSRATVALKSYGFGQESAIKELVTRYYETYSPRYLTSNNLKRGYLADVEWPVSEIPVRDFQVNVDDIHFYSVTEAKLQVTYIKNSDVLSREDVYDYGIRKENGKWRIATDEWVYNRMELPADIGQKAEAIKRHDPDRQKAVLTDLNIYIDAYNSENFALTKQYTDPEVITHWNAAVRSVTWDDKQIGGFANADERYQLSGGQVVYLGDKEAVVQAGIHWSDATYGDGVDSEDDYEALIIMKYNNGHWNYSEDISLDQDFDDRS